MSLRYLFGESMLNVLGVFCKEGIFDLGWILRSIYIGIYNWYVVWR